MLGIDKFNVYKDQQNEKKVPKTLLEKHHQEFKY